MGLFDFLVKKANDFIEAGQQRKERMLLWQHLVMPDSPNKLILTEQQLKSITLQQAQNDLRIINDCTRLVESTTKPDVFFMRLNLLVEKSKHLADLGHYMKFSNVSPLAYNEVVNNYHETINHFLWRYFSDTFDKAEAMKTEKGKLGKYQKFYDSLQEYYCYMNEENIDYIETKYRAYTRKNSIKKKGTAKEKVGKNAPDTINVDSLLYDFTE